VEVLGVQPLFITIAATLLLSATAISLLPALRGLDRPAPPAPDGPSAEGGPAPI
jgi:hypothetical protein